MNGKGNVPPPEQSVIAVTLGDGPPSKEELAFYYPSKFTWEQLKLFVNSGDLGLLKRDKTLQLRYEEWAKGIRAEHGSPVNYLLKYRLRWGEPDGQAKIPSALDESAYMGTKGASSPESHTYFTADSPSELISVIQNDWPYSIPKHIEHTLIWTRVPILPHPHLVPPQVAAELSPSLLERVTARLQQDGIWGFTGSIDPPSSPLVLPESLGALSEWGITMDRLIVSPRGSQDEEDAIRRAGAEVHEFVKRRWNERQWETAWFVNPPRLQSVKGVAHAHVFARQKLAEESDAWDASHPA